MGLYEDLRNDLLKAGQLAIDQLILEDESLVNVMHDSLPLWYAIHESDAVVKAMRKLAETRKANGVSIDQMSVLLTRIAGAPGRSKRASRKVLKLKGQVGKSPTDDKLKEKLECALESEKKAIAEATMCAGILAKAKKLTGGNNDG